MKAFLVVSFFVLMISCVEDPNNSEISRSSEKTEEVLAPEMEAMPLSNEQKRSESAQEVMENLKKKRPANVNKFLENKN